MTRRLAALATALAGVVTLVSSLSANEPGRQLYLEAFEPGSAQAAAHALGAIGGLLTLWLAAGVLRGRRSAGRAAVVVLCVLAAVHIAKGLDYEEALIALVVAVVLHRALQQVGQPDRRPSRRLVATLGLLGVTVRRVGNVRENHLPHHLSVAPADAPWLDGSTPTAAGTPMTIERAAVHSVLPIPAEWPEISRIVSDEA